MAKTFISCSLAAVLLALGSTAIAQTTFCAATLSGGEVVPPVDTLADGSAKFRLSRDGSALRYRVRVGGTDGITTSHVHCGAVGENGPPGISLFSDLSSADVTVEDLTHKGTIFGPDAGNGCGWASLADAVNAMENGDAFVMVHTLAVPPGEVRGQIACTP